jgi:hypothetical protein
MQEFTTVSSSSYDPAALATKLNEKSAIGWSVVSIVSTGGDVTAFLSREAVSPTTSVASTTGTSADSTWGLGDTGAAGATGAASALSLASVAQPDPEPVIAPVAEPAGWGVAPEPAATTSAASYTPTVAAVEPAPVEPAPVEPAPAAAPTPSVPAGWYADPAGRFELRYWDGGTWTEHVSRAGQQYTDPPVA